MGTSSAQTGTEEKGDDSKTDLETFKERALAGLSYDFSCFKESLF